MSYGTLLLILTSWFAFGLVLIGIGSLFRRACRSPADGTDGLLLSFWIGWVCVLYVLQLWHLFLPVDTRALCVLGALGVVGLGASGKRAWLALARGLRRHWLALAVWLAVAAWLSNRALGGVMNGDSGVYHIPTVRWLIEYPVVPGLGNLFRPLAFNQSYFLYVAMLEVGPFVRGSHHLANGILVLALFAQAEHRP